MKKFETIKEFFEAVQQGQIKEENVRIVLDNDDTSFYDESLPENEQDIVVKEAYGYADIEPLYKLLFPKANVHWC